MISLAPLVLAIGSSHLTVRFGRVRSEITAEGKRVTKLDQILLNGNNVALVRRAASPARTISLRLARALTRLWSAARVPAVAVGAGRHWSRGSMM